MKDVLSSRQRMLAALSHQEVDHPPCSFMLFKGLLTSRQNYPQFIERQLEMGLDAFVQIPPRPPQVVNDHYNLHGLPVSYDPRVEIEEWKEDRDDELYPILLKEYHTPDGILRVEVRQTEEWPWGDHVPFLDDHIVSRSTKFLVSEREDLAFLRYLLIPPTQNEVATFKKESKPVLDLAKQHDLLTVGGWGVGADMVGWIFGLTNMIFASYDQPQFLHEMLEIIHLWNQSRMKVVLDRGVDLYIKRAWYENLDFWTPHSYREFLLPILKSDVELAHSYGAKLGYIITSNCMSLLEIFAEIGIDALIGIDPAEWDLATTKQRIGDQICLWGGINGHLTIEQGTTEMVRHEVDQAVETLAPGSGFILSPVDNVREITPRANENIQTLILEWQKVTGQKTSH
jgi:hypothetical protein